MPLLAKYLLQLSDLMNYGGKRFRDAAKRLSKEMSTQLIECEHENWQNVHPCFVLSTGRAGTLLLNKLFSLSKTHSRFINRLQNSFALQNALMKIYQNHGRFIVRCLRALERNIYQNLYSGKKNISKPIIASQILFDIFVV